MVIDESDAIARLRRGEVVALPTDTVYGVAVAVDVAEATAKLFRLKDRPVNVALPVLIADRGDAEIYAEFSHDFTGYWPGALTVVGRRTVSSEAWDLGGDITTVGLRCPDDDQLRRIAAVVGPLVTTSANKHGEPPCTTQAEVAAALGDDVPVLDGGLRNGEPSTVVDATQTPFRVLRQGAVIVG